MNSLKLLELKQYPSNSVYHLKSALKYPISFCTFAKAIHRGINKTEYEL